MSETLPADIAAALTAYGLMAKHFGSVNARDEPQTFAQHQDAVLYLRAALEATILRHLRGQTEMRDELVTELTRA